MALTKVSNKFPSFLEDPGIIRNWIFSGALWWARAPILETTGIEYKVADSQAKFLSVYYIRLEHTFNDHYKHLVVKSSSRHHNLHTTTQKQSVGVCK